MVLELSKKTRDCVSGGSGLHFKNIKDNVCDDVEFGKMTGTKVTRARVPRTQPSKARNVQPRVAKKNRNFFQKVEKRVETTFHEHIKLMLLVILIGLLVGAAIYHRHHDKLAHVGGGLLETLF